MATSGLPPRHVRFTRKQLLGLPLILGIPIAALAGAFGDDRTHLVARVAFAYLFMLVCFRVLGKRELGQMSPFEIVTLFLVPQLLRNAVIGTDYSVLTGVVATLALFALVYLTSLLRYRSEQVGRIVQAKPTVLVHDGQLAPDALDRERITPDDILSAIHKAGLERFGQVKWAILESDGKIGVVPVAPGAEAPPGIPR